MKLLDKIKRFLGFKPKEEPLKIIPTVKDEKALEKIDKLVEELYGPTPKPRHVCSTTLGRPRKAVYQDIGKFMKHGKQSKQYRRSIKAKIKPEEEN